METKVTKVNLLCKRWKGWICVCERIGIKEKLFRYRRAELRRAVRPADTQHKQTHHFSFKDKKHTHTHTGDMYMSEYVSVGCQLHAASAMTRRDWAPQSFFPRRAVTNVQWQVHSQATGLGPATLAAVGTGVRETRREPHCCGTGAEGEWREGMVLTFAELGFLWIIFFPESRFDKLVIS